MTTITSVTTSCVPSAERDEKEEEESKSVTSADEALYELLGIGGQNDIHFDDDEDDADNANKDDDENDVPSSFAILELPPHCQRPDSSFTEVLWTSSPQLLSKSQCQYIIYNLGYRTTNNGGTTYGPTYVDAASPYHSTINNNNHNNKNNNNDDDSNDEIANNNNNNKVQLVSPNHHKVCVFTNEIVLTWIQQGLIKCGIHDAILEWTKHNQQVPPTSKNYITDNNKGNNNYNTIQTHSSPPETSYRINPRLRLLRYDACDDDIFVPHYDATTFYQNDWVSYLTILVYLNTGNGVDFDGGNTLFLNALEPSTTSTSTSTSTSSSSSNCTIVPPRLGQIVVFPHDLFHASQALEYNSNLSSDKGGGTKFILRTDVLFHTSNSFVVANNHNNDNNNDDVTRNKNMKNADISTTTAPSNGKISNDNNQEEEEEEDIVTVATIVETMRKRDNSQNDDNNDTASNMNNDNNNHNHNNNLQRLQRILEQEDLDLYHTSVASLMVVPGRRALQSILMEYVISNTSTYVDDDDDLILVGGDIVEHFLDECHRHTATAAAPK